MISIHSIKGTSQFSDMFLAQLWTVLKSTNDYPFMRIVKGRPIDDDYDNHHYEAECPDDLYYIQRSDDGSEYWTTWYVEPERLTQWKLAGKPMPDMNNFPIVEL